MLKISGGYTGAQPVSPGIAGNPGTGTDRSHRVQSITSPAKEEWAVSACPQTAQKNEMDDMVRIQFSQAIEIPRFAIDTTCLRALLMGVKRET